MSRFIFFTRGYPFVPAQFVRKTLCSSLYGFAPSSKIRTSKTIIFVKFISEDSSETHPMALTLLLFSLLYFCSRYLNCVQASCVCERYLGKMGMDAHLKISAELRLIRLSLIKMDLLCPVSLWINVNRVIEINYIM